MSRRALSDAAGGVSRTEPAGRGDGESGGRRASGDVALAARGDGAAFERLYRSHVDSVYAVCLRMVADPVAAEQLTQDVFVRAWRKVGLFRGESSFRTWLHRMAVNLVLNVQRAERRQRIAGRFDDEGFMAPADAGVAAGVSAPSVALGARLDLERTIARLPRDVRTVFVLHLVQGYGHREIGAMLGISVSSSKARLHRARGHLRRVLGEDDDPTWTPGPGRRAA